MGKESRGRESQEAIGKYNVCITLLFKNAQDMFMQEKINCKTWNHVNQFLAIQLFDGTLRIVCLDKYHGFTISPIDPEWLAERDRTDEESIIKH